MSLKKFANITHSYDRPTWRVWADCQPWAPSYAQLAAKSCKRRMTDPAYQPPWSVLYSDAIATYQILGDLESSDTLSRILANWQAVQMLQKWSPGFSFSVTTATERNLEQRADALDFLKQFADREARSLLQAPIRLRTDMLRLAQQWRDTGSPPIEAAALQRQAMPLYVQLEIVRKPSPLEEEVAAAKEGSKLSKSGLIAAGLLAAVGAFLVFR